MIMRNLVSDSLLVEQQVWFFLDFSTPEAFFSK